MSKQEDIRFCLQGCIIGRAVGLLDVIAVPVGHKNAAALDQQYPPVWDFGKAVTVSADVLHRLHGEPALELLEIPAQVPQMEHQIRLLPANRLLHMVHIAVRIGKNSHFHYSHLPQNGTYNTSRPVIESVEGYYTPKQQPSGNVLKSAQAARLLQDKAAVEKLIQSPDTKLLMDMLSREGGLKQAAEAAMKGDTSELQSMLDRLMKNPEGASAVERLSRSAPK